VYNRKTKKYKRVCSELTVKVWGIHVVSPEEEKKRLRHEKEGRESTVRRNCEKIGFKPAVKE